MGYKAWREFYCDKCMETISVPDNKSEQEILYPAGWVLVQRPQYGAAGITREPVHFCKKCVHEEMAEEYL